MLTHARRQERIYGSLARFVTPTGVAVKRLALLAALFVFLGTSPFTLSPVALAHPQATLVAADALPLLFSTEDAAQTHCPRDVVAWLNISSGIYHYKGERWYARTKNGAFVCQKEAAASGARGTRNGQ